MTLVLQSINKQLTNRKDYLINQIINIQINKIMEINKKVNEFGIFSSIIVLSNSVTNTVGAVRKTDDDSILEITSHLTTKAIMDSLEDGASCVEQLLTTVEAATTTDITVITPDKKDIKLFLEAVVKTAEDGNMSHMKDYVKESGNDIPQDIWDYIYELTNGH